MFDSFRLDEAVEFAENPEARCPCVLLLDTSGSMQGTPIDALNEGLYALKEDLMKNSLASRRVEVAVVTFNSARINSFRNRNSSCFRHNSRTQSIVSCEWSCLLSSLDIYDYRWRSPRRARGNN